ncbi:histidine kinase [Microbulbifer discodermiae]|uniref:histidine kinase n=1 Tax=Microbulbifer sp. 2201CG32-9 TaxID=3232309 RepID=UPI00345BC432
MSTLGQTQRVTLSFEAVKRFRFDWTDVEDATHYRLLENPDGLSGFSAVGGDVGQGTETLVLEVPLYARANAQYILQDCRGEGLQEECNDSDILSVTGTLVDSIGYFKASNTDGGDRFGSALSLSADGNTLAIGAPLEGGTATGINGDQSGNTAEESGAVYIFGRNAGIWTQQAYVKASNTDAGDRFGEAVSLSADGTTLAVGASSESSSADGIDGDQSNNDLNGSGAVYIFSRNEGAWAQQAYIKASNPDELDFFGGALSLSGDGNTLAVGAGEESSSATGVDGDQNNNDVEGAGAVYIFNRSEGDWTQQAYIKASNTDRGDHFSSALSLSADGNTLAVSTIFEDSNAIGVDGDQGNNDTFNAGAVYIYSHSQGAWTQQAYVKASNTDAGDYFGYALSLSGDGNILAVGAGEEDSRATGIGGDQNNNDAARAGAVYIFNRNGGVWAQRAYVKASNSQAGDQFGEALNLSEDGNTLAVGAFDDDSSATGINGDETLNDMGESGAVYVYKYSEGSWSQQSYVKASNTDVNDEFGLAIGLSAEGATLAVGAYFEDSNATGIDGDQTNNDAKYSGAVYVY